MPYTSCFIAFSSEVALRVMLYIGAAAHSRDFMQKTKTGMLHRGHAARNDMNELGWNRTGIGGSVIFDPAMTQPFLLKTPAQTIRSFILLVSVDAMMPTAHASSIGTLAAFDKLQCLQRALYDSCLRNFPTKVIVTSALTRLARQRCFSELS